MLSPFCRDTQITQQHTGAQLRQSKHLQGSAACERQLNSTPTFLLRKVASPQPGLSLEDLKNYKLMTHPPETEVRVAAAASVGSHGLWQPGDCQAVAAHHSGHHLTGQQQLVRSLQRRDCRQTQQQQSRALECRCCWHQPRKRSDMAAEEHKQMVVANGSGLSVCQETHVPAISQAERRGCSTAVRVQTHREQYACDSHGDSTTSNCPGAASGWYCTMPMPMSCRLATMSFSTGAAAGQHSTARHTCPYTHLICQQDGPSTVSVSTQPFRVHTHTHTPAQQQSHHTAT
jgi:hypothetical protein